MQQSEIKKLSDILDYGEHLFKKAKLYYGHGTDNPWDEAVFLVLTYLQLPFEDNVHLLQREISIDERDAILELFVRRIQERVPAPYLVHESWFCGLPFYVDERVLIPRSPIGELIVQQFTPWIDAAKVENILDIGTGSGAIAICCAKAFPDAQVDAIDIDEDALAVANKNILRHDLGKRVHAIKSDLFMALPNKRYDIIVSNPPYVEEGEMQFLPKEYYHEPRQALAAGEDGLDIVRRILVEAKQHLTSNGILVVEVAQSRPALEQAFPKLPMIWLDFENGGDGVFVLQNSDYSL